MYVCGRTVLEGCGAQIVERDNVFGQGRNIVIFVFQKSNFYLIFRCAFT